MLVANWMTRNPVSVAPTAMLGEAVDLLRRHHVRHLPVVDGGRVVGIITDRDVRSALPPVQDDRQRDLAAALSRPVIAIMSRDPLTVPSALPIEEAGRLFYERRIGGLPVVDSGRLVGILTSDDALRAFVAGSGVLQPSSRLELLLPDRPGALAEALAVIGQHQANVVSVTTVPISDRDEMGTRRVVVRLATIDPRPVVARLTDAGVVVRWAPGPSEAASA